MMNHGIHRIHEIGMLAVLTLGASLAVFAADPTITVSAQQRYPWNGLVDLNFTIMGEEGTRYATSFMLCRLVCHASFGGRQWLTGA